MLHAEETNWSRTFIGGGRDVEQMALWRWHLPRFIAVNSADDLPSGGPEGVGMVLMGWGNDRYVKEG